MIARLLIEAAIGAAGGYLLGWQVGTWAESRWPRERK